ncbi:hypothetical protein DL766_006401 [Monosporascus sp. MC13-8B]|uniref:N-acetyltransferase domain-containing protein n=1 Tax=Monosporascus cannonballus TaxID=155416 RepID=A0ABY0H6Z2_9PEZI|nr:hypothetical protein DL763_010446 [Monosporascus cannonballus]RYO83282.1 hypothetical protein DL762_006191 [Monosporascus cannonballus]RYP27404.1 hypothetical protein DL766_006401 [Monosporascus sp. MC13-8B]
MVLQWDKEWALQYLIKQPSKRLPHGLLEDRAHKRHQKVVDYETGQMVGCRRWILPDHLTGEWLEAQTPAVSSDEEEEYAESPGNADCEYGAVLDTLGVPVVSLKKRLMGREGYMGGLPFSPSACSGHDIVTLLVESGIAQAEEMGVDIFVLAFKVATGVYHQLGFEMLGQFVPDDSKYGGKSEYGTYFLGKVGKRL